MAQNMYCCFPLNEGGGNRVYDAADNVGVTLNSMFFASSKYGSSVSGPASGATVGKSGIVPHLFIQPPLSIFAAIEIFGTPPAYNGLFGVKRGDGAAPYVDFGLEFNVSGKIAMSWNNAGSFSWTTTACNSTIAPLNTLCFLVGIIKNDYQAIYNNGIKIAETTNALTSITFDPADSIIWLGGNNIKVIYSGIIDRELTLSEIISFYSDPFAVFRPSMPYYLMASQEEAGGISHAVMGVAGANIGKVVGVDAANVGKVAGVEV